MTYQDALNALTSVIDCVQKDILAGNRGSVMIDPQEVRPFDELDKDFALYSASREE